MDKIYTLFLIINILSLIGLTTAFVRNSILIKKEIEEAIQLDKIEKEATRKRDFRQDYEFLDIHIGLECKAAFDLMQLQGVDFLATKHINIVVEDVCKNIYEKISEDYKLTLLTYFSKVGLYEHIFQRVFENVMRYAKKLNDTSKVAWKKY